ncbi:MAG: pyruvate dehydrogenase E2 component (dihydrolipoamide acetyltransferase) [Acidimicrobiales bacterium]
MTDVFELPSLGADMETGTVLEWYVQPGDRVERGSLVALVSTEKADVDVEIWQAGVVAEFLVDVGQEIPIGTPLLRLGEPAVDSRTDSDSRTDFDARTDAVGSSQSTPIAHVVQTATETETKTAPAILAPAAVRTLAGRDVGRVRASPRARAVAEQQGIDLTAVAGTGPGGAVLERDLTQLAVASKPAGATQAESASSLAADDRRAAMRRVIADRMAKANAEIPHYHLDLDVDMGQAMAWLEAHNEKLDLSERVLPAALLLQATAVASVAVPELNGNWGDGAFRPVEGSDVAVVVSLRGGGLVTPKIADVADRSTDDVMGALKEVVAGARRGALRSSWMSPAGITVTNLGDRGADRVHGVIFPPQVGLVGFGGIRSQPWVIEGEIVVRPVVTVSLTADHRATDAAIGSRFLRTLAKHLQTLEGS